MNTFKLLLSINFFLFALEINVISFFLLLKRNYRNSFLFSLIFVFLNSLINFIVYSYTNAFEFLFLGIIYIFINILLWTVISMIWFLKSDTPEEIDSFDEDGDTDDDVLNEFED